MSISVALRHSFPGISIDAAFQSQGGLTALFGPSGCGKTTIINAIAGLLVPQEARIVAEGVPITDTARGITLPVHARRIGYVFQDTRLFPHLTVQQNLRYGRWFTPPGQRFIEEDALVPLLGLEALLPRRPGQLSGGERQRVAIGRALLQSPRLLLMDEPLAALDEARKLEVLPYIERLRDELKVPIIYVSHSAAEVARLATGLVLIDKGRVVKAGPAAEVLPHLGLLGQAFAREAGTLVDMQVTGHDAASDLTHLSSPLGPVRLAGPVAPPHTQLRVVIKSTDVMLATEEPRGISALNSFTGVVSAIVVCAGASADVTVQCGAGQLVARITRHSVERLGLAPGQTVHAVVKAMSVQVAG
ncbi:MAG: molybdenum ABC transporter ATP-binding protein [Hyphomicrobiales bacterium]